MNGLYNPKVAPKPNGKLVYANVPRYWRNKGPSHNQAFYSFGSRTNIKHNFSREDLSQFDKQSKAPSVMSYDKCNKIGLKFKDLKKQMQSVPREASSTNEQYDHDPMVKMNDYTKNISQDIFNNGGNKRPSIPSTMSKSVISKKSITGSEFLTKYSVNYNTKRPERAPNKKDALSVRSSV